MTRISTLVFLVSIFHSLCYGGSPEEEIEVMFELSGEELSLDFTEKLLLPMNDFLNHARGYALDVRQQSMKQENDNSITVQDSLVRSVVSSDEKSDSEYFSKINSRVDEPTELELENVSKRMNLRARLLEIPTPLHDRRRNLIKQIDAVRVPPQVKPGGAFCCVDGTFRMVLLPNAYRVVATKKSCLGLTEYARYRYAPFFLGTEIAYASSFSSRGNAGFLETKPIKAVVYTDGSTKVVWTLPPLLFAVDFDNDFGGLPTRLSAHNNNLTNAPFATTWATWERDDENFFVLSSVESNYSAKSLLPPGSNGRNAHIVLEYKWSKLKDAERKRCLSPDTFLPHLDPVVAFEKEPVTSETTVK